MATEFDIAKISSMIMRFQAYIRNRDGMMNKEISFVDRNSYLGREENYKAQIAKEAQDVLDYSNWKKSWVGDNTEIRKRILEAMRISGNLVNINQKLRFMNKLDPKRDEFNPLAEKAIYDIYNSKSKEDEAAAFSQAKSIFGGFYDTLAYLFFIKDSSRFLPVSPGNFEKSLSSIGIEYKLSRKCSWENYIGFIDIVRNIQGIMKEVMPGIDIRLIDAHSFLWIINENRKDDFRNWKPSQEYETILEQETEDYLQRTIEGHGIRKNRTSSVYSRSAEVGKATKERAKGICELCGEFAPFLDKNNIPYLEVHHVVWLSRGGRDSTDNTVALCPNCHTRIHVRDDKDDTERLMAILR